MLSFGLFVIVKVHGLYVKFKYHFLKKLRWQKTAAPPEREIASRGSGGRFTLRRLFAGVAQLVERLICNQ